MFIGKDLYYMMWDVESTLEDAPFTFANYNFWNVTSKASKQVYETLLLWDEVEHANYRA